MNVKFRPKNNNVRIALFNLLNERKNRKKMKKNREKMLFFGWILFGLSSGELLNLKLSCSDDDIDGKTFKEFWVILVLYIG